MAQKPHEFASLASALQEEISRTAAAIAPSLPFAQPGGDAVRLTRAQALDHVRFNWSGTPGFPQALLDRMAPKDAAGMRPLVGLKAYQKMVGEAFPEGSPQWHAQQQMAMTPQPAGSPNGASIGAQGMNLAPQEGPT